MRVGGVFENQLVDPQKGAHVRLIVVAQPFLFLYRVALVIQILLRHLQRTHAIALQPERKCDVISRQGLKIVCALGRGCSVHCSTGVEDVLKVSRLWNVLRALEHHVLEKMGKSGSTFFLIARTDIVINGDRYHRNGLILAQYYAKAIGKSELFDRRWWEFESFCHVSLDSSISFRRALVRKTLPDRKSRAELARVL